MTEIFNLHTLCRCCHSDGNFKSLQLSYAYGNRIEVYSTMLQETLEITIKPPQFEASYAICNYCIQKLRDAANFKQQVLECEQKFEEYCKNEQAFTIKEEIDYNNCSDSGWDRNEKNPELDDFTDKKSDENKDIKCDANFGKININGNDNIDNINDVKIDNIYHVKIEKEDNEATSPKVVQNTISIEYPNLENINALVYKTNSDQIGDNINNRVPTISSDISSNVFKCQFCSKSFSTKKSLKTHVNIHTSTKKFQCDMCQKFFPLKQALRKHLIWHYTVNQTSMCNICGRSFKDRFNLNAHIRTVHEEKRPYKCNVCTKAFKVNKLLKLHMYLHTGETPYKCDLCIDEFGSPWKLKHHQFKCHSNSLEGKNMKIYTCKICKQQFARQEKFMVHMKTHTGLRDNKCHLCPKDFACKYSLKRHISEHSGIKFCCDMCDKKYTQQSQLTRHKKRFHNPNSTSKPDQITEKFKCGLCNKRFEDIDKHMKVHKIRPYSCELCTKSYPEKSSLNTHISIVHQGVRRHHCHLCDKKYAKRASLVQHAKKIHKLDLSKKATDLDKNI